MSPSVKLLKGFRNPINDEMNTLSLLVKSNLDLKEHIRNAKDKLLTVLRCIMENYDGNHIIYFYHKIQVLYERKTEYLSTKDYLTDLVNLKIDLNSSVEEVIKMTYGKKTSHFVNLTIKSNDEVIELSQKEFKDLNSKLISALSKMNEEYLFIDDNLKTIKKNKKDTSVKPIKNAIDDDYLFIDEEKVEPFKKNEKNTSVKPIKNTINNDCLFIDEGKVKVKPFKKNKKNTSVKPIKNAIDDSLFID